MKHILVAGAGALGIRHMQAILLSKQPYHIILLDINPSAFEKGREVFASSTKNAEHTLDCMTSAEQLPDSIEVAVVATCANVRAKIVKEIVQSTKVSYVILEKVLFQRVEEYEEIESLLKEHQIKAYVNCPRRMQPYYKQLKEQLKDATKMEISVAGANWGLACNAIHFIDMIAYLTGEQDVAISLDQLEDACIESKRAGFVEVLGTITGKLGKCERFQISCYDQIEMPLTINIISDVARVTLDEGKRVMMVSSKENDWNWEMCEITMYYQSQLTHLVVKELLETGTCSLTSYEESKKLHLSFLFPLSEYFAKQGMEEKLCPIT